MGETLTIKSSEFIRKAGYSVLVLGFYYWAGMPKEMYRIPVEYVENAVAELKRNGFKKIAIHGMSTGAGYALLCASMIPDISCTIAVAPYDYIMEAMKNDLFPLGFGVYSYQEKSLPYSKYTLLNHGIWNALRSFLKIKKSRGYKMGHIMRHAYDTSEETDSSRIKVENMKSDILIMAPAVDDCWPSEQAVPRIEKILKSANYPYRVKAIVYDKASHILEMDMTMLLRNPFMKFLTYSLMRMEKKYPKECEDARKDSMVQILDFLSTW